MRGTLVHIQPLDPVAGSRVSIRVGMSMNPAILTADGQQWQNNILKAPVISMDFMDVNFTGRVQTGKCSLSIDTRDLYFGTTKLTRTQIDKLIWKGAPISVWNGSGRATASMVPMFNGLVMGGQVNRNSRQLTLQCEVNKRLIDVPLLNLEYGGGGGADGDVDFRGQLKPASFGSPVNVEVFFFDITNNVGQIDAYGNVTAIDTLYEDAASFGTKHGNYASYAALVAAAIPEGKWGTCVAEGLIRLGAAPRGVITCDPVCGAGTPGAMMLRWLQTHAGVSAGNIDSTTFTTLDSTLATLLGHAAACSYHTRSQVNVDQLMQDMCGSVNAVPMIRPDGKIAVARQISALSPALTIDRIGGDNPATDWRDFEKPDIYWRLKSIAAISYRVHSKDEIDYNDDLVDRGDYNPAETYREGHIVRLPADGKRYLYINATPSGIGPPNATYWTLYEDAPDAAVLQYIDGTPIEALKPAALGADVTGANTAAAIAGQGPGATAAGIYVLNQYVGIGENVIPNSGFEQGTKHFAGGWAGNSGFTPIRLVNGSGGYFGAMNVAGVNLTGAPTPANDTVTDGFVHLLATEGSALKNVQRYCLPVQPGDRVFASAMAAFHRMKHVIVNLQFMDGSGAYHSEVGFNGGRNGGAANGDPVNFDRVGGFFDIPVGSPIRFVWLNIRGVYNGVGVDPYFFYTQLMLCKVAPGQTAWPPYQKSKGDAFADVTSENAAVSDGNRVRYSKFEAGTVGWGVLYNPSGLAMTPTIYVSPTNGRRWYQSPITFTANGQTASVGSSLAIGTRIPIVPGERISVQMIVSLGAANAAHNYQAVVQFASSQTGPISGTTIGVGSGAVEGRIHGFVTAPSNADWAWLEVYVYSSFGGAGTTYISVSEPMVSTAGPSQTAIPTWVPGPSNEYGADVTAVVTGPAAITYTYDYLGTLDPSAQMPAGVEYKLTANGAVVSSGLTWTYTVKGGTFNGFTTASGPQSMTGSGIGTLTVNSIGTNDATVEVRATQPNGISRTFTTVFTKQFAAPPTGGGGGGGGSGTIASKSSGFTSFSTTSFVDITGTINFTTPAGVTDVDFNMNLEAYRGSNGTSGLEMKFQRFIGGVWTDQGSVQSSGSEKANYSDPPETINNPGVFNYNYNVTGLTASTAYQMRVVARCSSGAASHSVSGTVSVVDD